MRGQETTQTPLIEDGVNSAQRGSSARRAGNTMERLAASVFG